MGIAQYSVMQDAEVLKESLLDLNNYLIKNNNSILLPGRFGYKFSSDLETGSAGLLALLNDIQTNKWNTWLPIIFSSNNLFSN